jgi:hypothetical protein
MTTLFQARSGGPQKPPATGGTIADYTGRTSRYLTDGVILYRFLGAVASGMGQMVGLENCRSLDVTWLPVGELRARRLRAVMPASSEN